LLYVRSYIRFKTRAEHAVTH